MESKTDDYQIIGTIHDSDNSTIFRARHNATGNEVIMKQSKGMIKSGLYNEYNLIRENAGDNSIIQLTRREQTPALIRKFYPGNTLRKELSEGKAGLDLFFNS